MNPPPLTWGARLLRNPWTHVLTGAGVLLLDLSTSKYLLFPIMFVGPIALAAWHCRVGWAYALSALLPAGRVLVALHEGVAIPTGYLVANGFTRGVVLALLAFFIARTARQTRALREQVAGLVTICAWSRTVEFEGEWVSFEKYLKRRFGVDTSHGISPEEMAKALGERGLDVPKPAVLGRGVPRA